MTSPQGHHPAGKRMHDADNHQRNDEDKQDFGGVLVKKTKRVTAPVGDKFAHLLPCRKAERMDNRGWHGHARL